MNETPPSIYEELNRKTVDSLAWLWEEHQANRISDEALKVGVIALYHAVSGLVSPELLPYLSVPPAHPRERKDEVRIIKNPNGVVILRASWQLLILEIFMVSMKKHTVGKMVKRVGNPQELKSVLEKNVEALLHRRATEL